MRLLARLVSSLHTWPDTKGWRDCLLMALPALAVVPLLGLAGGFVHWQPRLDNWPLHLLSVLIVPTFSEEVVFRGLLIPARGETQRPVTWIAAGVAIFTAWHIVEARTFLSGAHLFMTPLFLLAAVMLGLSCALLRYRTGSIWPAVILHCLVVFVWQVWFSGPSVSDLRG